jgi:hypothetical protein
MVALQFFKCGKSFALFFKAIETSDPDVTFCHKIGCCILPSEASRSLKGN